MTPRGLTPEQRFKRMIEVDPDTDCWMWTGSVARSGGRPQFAPGGRTLAGNSANCMATHWAFQHYKGVSVPRHARLWPICQHQRCVNPDHQASHRFVCKRGHPLKDGSVIWERKDGRWTRRCVECTYSHEPPEGVFVVNLD